jgi:hypothetical protein
MSDLDDIFEQYRDADALRNVPFRPDQFSQLQTDLDGEQYGMVGEVAIPFGQRRYVGRGGQVYDEPPPGVGIEIGTSETPVQATEGSTGEDMARGAVRGASRASQAIVEIAPKLGASVDRDMARGAVRGASRAGQAIVETAPMLGAPVDLVNEGLRAIGIPVSDEPFMGSESIKKGISNFMDWADRTFVPQAADDAFRRFVEEDPTSPLAQSIVEELTRFGAQAVTPGAALRAFKVGIPVVRGLAWGAIADFINAEPDEKLIVQEIAEALSGASEDERGAVASAIMDVLFVNETDPQVIRKAKFALEGMVIGGAIEGGVQLLIRAAKAVPWQEIMGSLAEAGRAADERIAELSRGGTMMANPIAAATDVVVSGAGRVAGALSPSMSEVSPRMVSARYPTAVKRVEDPVSSQLNIGYEAIAADPKLLRRNTDILRAYPGARADAAVDPEEFAAQFISDAKENLIWLHNRVPEATRMRSKLWYEGANKLAKELSGKYGIPDTAVAGVMAALSPQNDWFMNVSLAERTLEVLANKQGFAINGAMLARMEEIFPGEKYAALREAMTGKTLGELKDPTEKAFFVRLYDETFADRTHRIITPEGNRGDVVLTDKGLPSGTSWGSLVEISKAVRAFESGGDRVLMTEILGKKHKVRSFYNNIIEPNSANGDVTIDTHAVAAALLRPLSGQRAEVHHNFGSAPLKVKQPKGWQAAANSSKTGVQGTYGLYAQAYRDAAQELGLLPRELQSITWEAIRGLFDAGFKTPKNTSMVDDLWRSHAQGRLSIDEVRKAVEDAAGGISAPSWE